jgi:hypothetical protein
MFVALSIQHAMRMVISSSVASPTVQYYYTLTHKLHDIRKPFIEHKMCVLIFYKTLV